MLFLGPTKIAATGVTASRRCKALTGLSIELVLPVRAHDRRIGVHLGSEVAEEDERRGLAGVLVESGAK